MDVTVLEQGAWFSFKLRGGSELRLKLRPATEGEKRSWSSIDKDTTTSALLAPFVMGWNLAAGPDPIPCNEESKAKYLPFYTTAEFIESETDAETGRVREVGVVIGKRAVEIVGSLDFFSLG